MTWCRDGPVLVWLSKSLSRPQLPCQLAAGGTPASTSPSRTFSWVLPILPVIVVEKNQTKQRNSWLTLARSMLFSPRVYLSFAAPGMGRGTEDSPGRAEGCGSVVHPVPCCCGLAGAMPEAEGTCPQWHCSPQELFVGGARDRERVDVSRGREEGLAAFGLALQPRHNTKGVFSVSFLAD